LIRNEINIKLGELKNTKRVLDDKAKQLFEVSVGHILSRTLVLWLIEGKTIGRKREIISTKTST